jgi:hypothetical protein
MGCRRLPLSATVCAACLVLAPSALAAKRVFHPRVGPALGLIPAFGNKVSFSSRDVAQGKLSPVGTIWAKRLSCGCSATPCPGRPP